MNVDAQNLASAISQTNFTSFDWIIVIAYLLVSLAIGLFVKQFATNMANYIGAGRAVGTRLGIASMAGTEMGLITVMYSAEKGFKGGFAAFHIAVLSAAVCLIVGLTGFIVFRLRAMKVLTIPEFYERRFGKKVRVVGGIMLALGGILNMGLFLKVGSMFIVGITGLSGEGWALPAVMTTLLILVLAYTMMGGMISVVVTDYIQFVVLSFGLIIATVLAISHLGWNEIFTTIQSEMGRKGFDPLAEEGVFGIDYVAWMFVLGLVNCAIWPTAIARALIMKSPEAVKKQYQWASVGFLIRFLIPYFWGICAFVFIVTKAPELKALFFENADGKTLESPLYAMPVFLGRILPAGIIGLVSAAMIAAFMSTHDSYLLCWSSVITQDIIAPLSKNPLNAKKRVYLTRSIILAIGLYILYWGLIYDGGEDIWDYMAVTGAIYFTGAIALLIGGLYWRKASSVGAMCALIAGISAIFGLGPVQAVLFGENPTFPLTNIAMTGTRVGLATVALSFIALIVGSLLFPDKENPQLTSADA